MYKPFFRSHALCLGLALGLAPLAGFSQQGEHDHHQHHQAAGGDEADPHAHHKAMMKKPAEPAKSADVELLDRTLVDQDGREVKFVSDVIGDKIVVMDFVYTTCTTVCPVLTALFGQVQGQLGERLGEEVVRSSGVDFTLVRAAWFLRPSPGKLRLTRIGVLEIVYSLNFLVWAWLAARGSIEPA